MAIRVTAACTLRDLRLRGPGVATEEYWGYAYPGLVSVVGDTGAAGGAVARRVRVAITGLEVRRVGTSNGIKVVGAADVTITRSSICNCQRNGIIVQVRSLCRPGCRGWVRGILAGLFGFAAAGEGGMGGQRCRSRTGHASLVLWC